MKRFALVAAFVCGLFASELLACNPVGNAVCVIEYTPVVTGVLLEAPADLVVSELRASAFTQARLVGFTRRPFKRMNQVRRSHTLRCRLLRLSTIACCR